MLLSSTLDYLISFLLFFDPPASQSPRLQFQLKHSHAVANNSSRVIFHDVEPQMAVAHSNRRGYTISAKPVKVHRPRSFEAHTAARKQSIYKSESTPIDSLWNDEEVILGPDVSNLDTLITLAEMTSNSYVEPSDKKWYDLGPEWNQSFPFGWGPDQTGTRGHVFVSTDNSTVVLSIKGTSVALIGGGPTVAQDKLNDNLLFSCCCARVGPTWSTVCGCYSGGGKCNQDCLEKSLGDNSLFYNVAADLYNNVTYLYPDANIWLVGHSLGGALSSLIGVTFGVPVVAFEAPGEKMAAQRLHLPSPPSTQHITHVYHTADPIAMGVCTGVTSTCAIAGYAMESKCHLGKSIILDTISVLRWSSSVQNHPISVIIDQVLNITDIDWGYGMLPPPGEGEEETSLLGWPWTPKRGEDEDPVPRQPVVPDPVDETDCVDCFAWEFGDF